MRHLLLVAPLLFATPAFATDCPNPGEPCKIITLSEGEEKALAGQSMVFDTAVQARSLDLGGVVTYFRQKIATAPAGTMLPKPDPKPAEHTGEAGKK